MAQILNVDKFPKEGNFDCVFGKNLTFADIEKKKASWTPNDTERLIKLNYHHLLIEEPTVAKKAEPTKPVAPVSRMFGLFDIVTSRFSSTTELDYVLFFKSF